ncbi:MAG TPA: MerR family transcriptional regulator [Thermoanaerobaculia bacterium]
MKIGELSRRTGLPPSALRYYEQERLIPPAPRRSGQRDYEDRDVTAVAVVQLARQAGFSIAEVRQLVGQFGRERWRRLAERKLDQVRETAGRLAEMTRLLEKLLECDCPDLDFCGRVIRKNARRLELRPASRPLSRRR